MTYSLLFTDTATQHYIQIGQYVAEKAQNVDVALHFIAELRSSLDILKTFPEAGPVPRDRFLAASGYRYLIHNDYLTFYKFDKPTNTITIHAVFNAKRDYKRFMKSL